MGRHAQANRRGSHCVTTVHPPPLIPGPANDEWTLSPLYSGPGYYQATMPNDPGIPGVAFILFKWRRDNGGPYQIDHEGFGDTPLYPASSAEFDGSVAYADATFTQISLYSDEQQVFY